MINRARKTNRIDIKWKKKNSNSSFQRRLQLETALAVADLMRQRKKTVKQTLKAKSKLLTKTINLSVCVCVKMNRWMGSNLVLVYLLFFFCFSSLVVVFGYSVYEPPPLAILSGKLLASYFNNKSRIPHNVFRFRIRFARIVCVSSLQHAALVWLLYQNRWKVLFYLWIGQRLKIFFMLRNCSQWADRLQHIETVEWKWNAIATMTYEFRNSMMTIIHEFCWFSHGLLQQENCWYFDSVGF